MTDRAERTSQMTIEEFERVAKIADRESDAFRLEIINGRIGDRSAPDGDHSTIIMWLLRQCIQARPDLDLHPERGLKVEGRRTGRARPDGVLAPVAHFAGQGEWAEPDGVLMTVEVTSYDAETDRRDRQEKPTAYAAAGIPVHVLIDRDAGTITVHSDPQPEGRGYRDIHAVKYSATLTLPEPVGIELATEELKGTRPAPELGRGADAREARARFRASS